MQTMIDWKTFFDAMANDLGGKMLSFRPQVRNSGGRTAFFADLEIGGHIQSLYVRAGRDQVPGPVAYEGLKYEKTIMEWLIERDVPVPRPVHLSKEPAALTMMAIEGDDDFLKVNQTPAGEAILSHYIDILADMHSHDVSPLSATGVYAPTGDTETALNHFNRFAVKAYRKSGTPVNPLCTWIVRWMTRHAPKSTGPLSLLQGDTGPGNFVYAGNRVQALVDWELAHIGDAMADLGSLRLRDVWTPFPGGIQTYFDQYQSRSGREIDYAAVRWYSIKLCVVHPFVLAAPFYQPQTTTTPAEWLAEYYSLSRLGLGEMAVYSGITLEKAALPAPHLTLQSRYHDTLTTALREEVMANIKEPYQYYRAEQAWRMAQYLSGAERYLDAIQEAEMEEIGIITSKPARNYEEALGQLNRFIENASPDEDEALLRFFYRQQSRMEALMPGAIGRCEGRSFAPVG